MGNKKRIELEGEIIRLFQEGNNVTKISSILKINRRDTVLVLQEKKIRRIFTRREEQEFLLKNTEKIIQLYIETNSIPALAKKLNCPFPITEARLSEFLKKHGQDVRKKDRKYKMNEDVFSDYNKFSCYWAGFMASDGCIASHKNWSPSYLLFSQNEPRESAVYKFKEFLETESPVTNKVSHTGSFSIGKTTYSLIICSKKICDDLAKNFNLTSNKTLTYQPPPNIPKELIRFFVLGLLDGDGSISFYTANTGRKHFGLSLTGTKETCDFFLNYIGKPDLVKTQRFPLRQVNNWSVCIQGNIQLNEILKDLYSDEEINKISLIQKYERYLLLKEQISKTYS